ncbi:NAD(P)-dependent oxidoreductase [Helcobacillus sp. ACRRO]|uniref:NAD-dependent epimerase/dehydratase family protein n=1 Tax=Helcobacillus sp. ACRRO TaxID=2918202 RepID=UPI001EF6A348|nr:NAD(P)-dependent oxidoreductase [Helcobacillus sp. ACRRO]MCG7427171.1 NAD(P)-dependent oxidoreductase [Helcobacillus sp. ACRRO]
MHIAITGGAGFIGRHVAAQLVDAGHTVIALDSLLDQVHADPMADADAFPGRVVKGDILDESAWAELGEAEGLIHLAAETGTGQSMYEQDRYRRVNVDGTRRAAQFAVEHDIPIVSLSSRAVYGEGRTLWPDRGIVFGERRGPGAVAEASRESDEHHPVSVYGETKSEAEAVLSKTTANRVPSAIIRPQNVIGYGQALHNPYTGVLAAFLARLREGRAISIYGDGLQTRDFVHVSDVARVIAWALQHCADTGEGIVVNTGSGERITLLDLAHFAIDASGRTDVAIEHVDVERAGDIQDAAADLTRLRELGGPMPAVSPRDAVADFIQSSWQQPGADSTVWDDALDELQDKGLTS